MAASQFDWTDGGAQSLTLDLHTQRHAPNKNRPTFAAESLDGTALEVVSVGSGQNEAAVMIEAEGDATGLRDMIDAMRRGISMTYTPDLDSPGTTFTVQAMPPLPAIRQQSEGRQSPLFLVGPVVLRRLDGGAFWP